MARLRLVVVCAALAGCAGVPVSSGGQDEILFAGAETIRILWNPQLTNERNVRAKARAYCSGRDVDEIDASPVPGAADHLRAKTWHCRSASGSGM
ncbi:hypothetical protein [Ramlibacter sp. AN1133]|uniref:hypothetical protein n=1 Tax=Ramlibacter sp. AN1133 TaxID=3133429 RepID=UPI0030BB8EEA